MSKNPPLSSDVCSVRRLAAGVLAVTWVAALSVCTADAAAIKIDDFSPPAQKVPYAINIMDPDPTLIETSDAAILGGERDLLVDVDGVSGPVSATGTVGGGTYMFGTVGLGALATLQYDGLDADVVGPPAQLVNSESLGGVDLTDGSTNHVLRLDFLFIDGGAGTTLGIEVEVHSSSGVATYAADIPHDPAPSTYWIAFVAFSDPSVFADVTSMEFTLNPTAVHDVDFELDYIGAEVQVPEPHVAVLMAGGMLACGWRRRGTR